LIRDVFNLQISCNTANVFHTGLIAGYDVFVITMHSVSRGWNKSGKIRVSHAD